MRILICDRCKEEIPTVKKPHPLTGKLTEYYRMGQLISPLGGVIRGNFGLDLCEKCAGDINVEIVRTTEEFKRNVCAG